MTEQEKQTESGSETGRLQPEERRTLLEDLQRLYHQIWRVIWAGRFQERDYGVARNPGILGSLNRHIDQAVEASRDQPPGVRLDDDPPEGDAVPSRAEDHSAEQAGQRGSDACGLAGYLESPRSGHLAGLCLRSNRFRFLCADGHGPLDR